MPGGSIKKYFSDKGFGFISADDGSGDLFAHKRHFNGNEADIRDGIRVTYEASMDDRSGKPKANTWGIEGGGGGGGGCGCGGGGFGAPQQAPGGGGGNGTGQLKKFFPEKGFGFITADDGSGDLFAPARTFTGADVEIQEGMKVTYEAGTDDKTGKPRASSWSSQGGFGGGASSGYGGFGVPAAYGAPGGYGACGCYGAMPNAGMVGGDRFSPYGGAPAFGGMPGAAAGAYGAPALPMGWEQVTDPGTGKAYYCNRTTGESSWILPQAAAAAPAPDPMLAVAPTGLPAGWEQAPDPASGKMYFFNRSTGATSWTPP